MQPLSSKTTEAPLATASLGSVGGHTMIPPLSIPRPISRTFFRGNCGGATCVLTSRGLWPGDVQCRCRGLSQRQELHGFPGAGELIGAPALQGRGAG